MKCHRAAKPIWIYSAQEKGIYTCSRTCLVSNKGTNMSHLSFDPPLNTFVHMPSHRLADIYKVAVFEPRWHPKRLITTHFYIFLLGSSCHCYYKSKGRTSGDREVKPQSFQVGKDGSNKHRTFTKRPPLVRLLLVRCFNHGVFQKWWYLSFLLAIDRFSRYEGMLRMTSQMCCFHWLCFGSDFGG